MINWLAIKIIRPFIQLLDFWAPFWNLGARLWISYIFLMAGISKVTAWQTTLLLFQYEYHVPLLSPFLAAVFGTAAELILPLLLVIGLGGRIVISIFFIYNAVCMIAYPFLWTPDGASGLAEHINWAILLGLLMCYGPGRISLDHIILRWHIRKTREKIFASEGL